MTYQEFNARQLTKNGFVRVPEEDFSDDGNRFKMYEYKGLLVSYLNRDGEFYISGRPDYKEGLDYNDYSKLPSYHKIDEFNGVANVDINKLVQNLDLFVEELRNMEQIIKPIKEELYNKYSEIQKLISTYDWAVEGANPPKGTTISRESAVDIRNSLVQLAGQVRL